MEMESLNNTPFDPVTSFIHSLVSFYSKQNKESSKRGISRQKFEWKIQNNLRCEMKFIPLYSVVFFYLLWDIPVILTGIEWNYQTFWIFRGIKKWNRVTAWDLEFKLKCARHIWRLLSEIQKLMLVALLGTLSNQYPVEPPLQHFRAKDFHQKRNPCPRRHYQVPVSSTSTVHDCFSTPFGRLGQNKVHLTLFKKIVRKSNCADELM